MLPSTASLRRRVCAKLDLIDVLVVAQRRGDTSSLAKELAKGLAAPYFACAGTIVQIMEALRERFIDYITPVVDKDDATALHAMAMAFLQPPEILEKLCKGETQVDHGLGPPVPRPDPDPSLPVDPLPPN